MLPWLPDVTIVQSDVTIVVPWQLSTGSKHDYHFCYCPLVGILFEVLRIRDNSDFIISINKCNGTNNKTNMVTILFFSLSMRTPSIEKSLWVWLSVVCR